MGSWNETCALSNMAICPGDKVVWLLLAENPYDNDYRCEMNDFYYVRNVPMFGEYDDYGMPRFDPGQESIVATIEQQFDYDRADKGSTLSFAELMQKFHEQNSVFVKQQKMTADGCVGEAARSVFPVMILRSVWDSFLKQTYDEKSKYGHSYLKVKEDLNRYLKHMKTGVEALSNKTSEDLDVARTLLVYSLYDDMENSYRNNFGPGIGGDIPFTASPTFVVRKIESEFIDGDIDFDSFSTIHSRLSQLIYVALIMKLNRMSWVVPTGTGSQLAAYELSANIHLSMTKVAVDKFGKLARTKEDRKHLNALKKLLKA